MGGWEKLFLAITAAVVSSCFFDGRHKDVDPFYTIRSYGQFPVMPIVKPIKLYYDKLDDEWGIDKLEYSLKQSISISDQKNIGVD